MKIPGGGVPPSKVPYLLPSLVLLLLLFAGCCSSSSSSGGESFVDVTSPGPGGSFQRLLVNRNSGRVYVGATNRLYQLSGSLVLEATVDNGPKEDNPNCPPPASECQCFGSNCKEFEKTQMDSVSKALVIDYRGDRLISCINLYQGHCDKHLLTDIRQKDNAIWTMLVPNDEDSPVVMFVAPGPPNPASTDVLYVAATRSTRGLPAYKDIVPAICMRSLQDLNFVSDDILTPSRIEIEVQQRDQFRVQYVYGFGSVGFSYFLMVQKPSALAESEQFITQMSRICQNDKSLYSYTEVPLECHRGGVNYSILRAAFLGYPGTNLAKSLGLPHIAPLTDMEHVLVAVFSNQTTAKASSSSSSSSSALCVYPMREIRKVFTETIQKCFQGTGNTGPDHFVQPKICQNTPLEIADDYCGQHDLNHPIKGTDPVLGQAVIVWNGVNVTSVAVTQTTDFTVAFLGTDDGHLKKVTIESRHSAKEFGSTLIERNGSIVGSSLSFDPTQEHIYVMTARKVSRVPVQNCSQYTTCQQCLEATDPYCGWCSLERRCSLRINCSSIEGAGSWLPYDLGQCPKVISISSTQAQKLSGSTSVIVISVGHLPQQLFTDLRCSFKGFGVTRVTMTTQTNGRPSENSTLRCDTPPANLLPPFPTGKDHIVMNLSLVSDGHDFLPVTNFTFFDCSIHNTCTLCTKSSFPCTWCVEDHYCTSTKEICTSNVLVTGKHVLGSSDTPGPEFCPRIESKKPNSTEILVASGSEIRLQVRAVHLQKYHSMFKCVFNFNGGVERNATLVKSGPETDVMCDPVLFNYSSPSPYLNVPFSVLWGARRRSLDNPNSVQVRVFKCSKMASNCGVCRSISLTHGCGWCAASNRCSVRDSCQTGPWMSRRDPCHNPTIHQIFPSSGPVEGGTRLTISGENLGIHEDETAATAADLPCHISHYITPSVKLVCVTGSSRNATSGPVVLNISGKYKAESSTPFDYVRSEVSGFQPDVGPVSGGTLLTISGRYLDAGSNATVLMSGGGPGGSWKVRCGVVSRDGGHVVCATGEGGQSPPPREADLVRLQIDGGAVDYSGGRFRFVPDPVVVMVDPEKTILSGGIKIFVTGERLNSVSHPKIVIYVPGANVTGPCKIIDEGRMTCTSPSLFVPGASLGGGGAGGVHWDSSAASPVPLHYGFIMDGVRTVRNISGSGSSSASPRGMMLAYPDPAFEAFDEGVKQFFYSKNEYLIINGKNINAVLNESDFHVDVGGVECVVKTVTSSQLMCLPSEQDTIPPTASVEVRIGNYSVHIGDLKYDSSDNVFTFTTIIAVTVAAGICLLIIIVICLAYRRKTKESERVVKHFTNQMNTLEARVATECKEAFAELQTDMVHVTSDICEQGGIPFRDYSSFCVRVMFPEDRSNDHPIMRSFDADNPSTEKAERGLDVFNNLVGSKTFLLIFIRVLEQQPDFTAREKVNVASLLSVTLQNRMEYHTDILRTLLADLIERAINGIHPKLLLRRTESVAEKMLTNWFTFLLYRFLRESAGEPLFLLFCAIKRQVEKGPIDALTSEAKYSLSEDKLIRQQLDFQVLTLAIVDPDSTVSCEVKVMDCDTITQAKEKILDAIYRSTPFSARPDKDDLDLEWLNHHSSVHSSKTRFILQDEDATTRLEGDVRRLNTLAYYRVPRDGARMALSPRRLDSVVNLSLSSEKIIPTFRDGFYNGSLPHSQSLSMSHTIRFMPEMGARSYHLIKSQENESNRNAKVEQCNKLVSEIYLTRLLATKMALDQFVKTLFETIFSTAGGNASLPLAIKYLFDFLDDQAVHHGITDPEVVHTWKSNSLPLRFWVNVIKNPDFIFDVHKSNIVDSCLSVVAQTFMDSCSMSEHKLSKDSPSSKLLYAKDIPGFKDMVISYYENIKRMPSVSDHEIQAMLRDESQIHKNEFNQSAALFELYLYTTKYSKDLMQELDADEFARRNHLGQQLELVHRSMEPDV